MNKYLKTGIVSAAVLFSQLACDEAPKTAPSLSQQPVKITKPVPAASPVFKSACTPISEDVLKDPNSKTGLFEKIYRYRGHDFLFLQTKGADGKINYSCQEISNTTLMQMVAEYYARTGEPMTIEIEEVREGSLIAETIEGKISGTFEITPLP